MKGRDFFDDFKEFVADVRKAADKAEAKIVERAAEEIDATDAEPEEVDAEDETETVETETETETEDVERKGEDDVDTKEK